MNGHKLSSTRQFNRHWQSGEEGGGYPPIPVYPSFGNYSKNIMMFDTHYLYNNGFIYNFQSMKCFINENRIYFEYSIMETHNTNKMIIPAHIELQLKDKFYFNTDDLFNQFPNGFHHINMIKTTFTFFGQDTDCYELTFDTNYDYGERYIEYDFTRAKINNISLNAYVMNAVGGAETRTYFDTWKLVGHPTLSSDNFTKRSNINFEKNVEGLVVRKSGHPIYPNILTGMYIPPYDISSLYATYDLNNLYSSSGYLILDGGTGDTFFRANSATSFSGVGVPEFEGITLDAGAFPVGYYEGSNYIYYCQYEGVDLHSVDSLTRFILSSDYDETVLSKVRVYTTY